MVLVLKVDGVACVLVGLMWKVTLVVGWLLELGYRDVCSKVHIVQTTIYYMAPTEPFSNISQLHLTTALFEATLSIFLYACIPNSNKLSFKVTIWYG